MTNHLFLTHLKTVGMMLLFLAFHTFVLAQDHAAVAEKYALVEVDMRHHQPADLAAIGIGLDHFKLDRHRHKMTVYLSYAEIDLLKANGYGFETLIEDATKHFVQNTAATQQVANIAKRNDIGCIDEIPYPVPSGFTLGSMGGYYTLAELMAQLDSLAAQYPNLISTRQPISNLTTQEGRSVYYVKISDNPNSSENEPEMLYTALHHAREPMSMMQMVLYMRYLLENYDNDPQVTAIVNNTELYFVPCLNPDGYVYNELSSPGGGGMWRKNRRDNGDGTHGVDLNRNYGYAWGNDDIGSSPLSGDETYRGASAFSEPETASIRQFCSQHHFKYALNYHSYSEVLLHPWGYGAIDFSEREYYAKLIENLTSKSHYNYGTCEQMLSYTANGNSDDWMYGEQSEKEKIYSATVEVGTAFWQPSQEIIPTCLHILPFNLQTAALLLNYARVRDISNYLIGSTTHQLIVDATRLGQQNGGSFTVSCLPISEQITDVSAPVTITNLTLGQTIRDTITLTIDPQALDDNADIYYVLQTDNGYYSTFDTIRRRAGHWELLLSDQFDNPNNWTTTLPTAPISTMPGSALVTDDYISAPTAYRSHTYQEHWFSQINTLYLTDVSEAYAQCQMKWDIVTRYNDLWWVPTHDGFTDDIIACGLYPKIGNDYVGLMPSYDGLQKEWVLETIDLNNALGLEVRLGFMANGSFGIDSYFMLDDLNVFMRGQNVVATNPIDAPNLTWYTYPNPTTDYIGINLANTVENISPQNPLQIQLHDITGRNVLSFTVDSHPFDGNYRLRLPVQKVPNGMYLLTIQQAGKSMGTKKIVLSN